MNIHFFQYFIFYLKSCCVDISKDKITFVEVAIRWWEFTGGSFRGLTIFQVLRFKCLISSERIGVNVTQLPRVSSFICLSLFKASFSLFSHSYPALSAGQELCLPYELEIYLCNYIRKHTCVSVYFYKNVFWGTGFWMSQRRKSLGVEMKAAGMSWSPISYSIAPDICGHSHGVWHLGGSVISE